MDQQKTDFWFGRPEPLSQSEKGLFNILNGSQKISLRKAKRHLINACSSINGFFRQASNAPVQKFKLCNIWRTVTTLPVFDLQADAEKNSMRDLSLKFVMFLNGPLTKVE